MKQASNLTGATFSAAFIMSSSRVSVSDAGRL
jgi:hypothetical protein